MPTDEQPRQTYYPAAKARLIIRFEDFGTDLVEPKSLKPPQMKKGIGNAELDIVSEDGRLVLRPKGSDGNVHGTPQEQVASDDGLTHEVGGIIPKYATISLNGIRTASSLSLELRYIDLPIDPRTVRACAVEVYLGTIAEEDFFRGIEGARRDADNGSTGEPLNMIPDTYVDGFGRERTNLRFQGWVDDWEVDWPKDAEPIVRLECTDNTRMLLDQPAPPKLVVGTKEPLDRAVATYLANFPQFRGLGVRYMPAGTDPPVLADALARTSHKPSLGPAAGGSGKLTIWDYLTDICGSVGHTVRFEGVDVVIQRARTLYSGEFSGRPDDPFTGRILPSGRRLDRRLMVYGRNVQSMNFRRKFTTSAPTNIEVRCYLGKRKKTLVARYPLKKDRVLRAPPGNETNDKWLVVRVSGIEDEKTLRVIAQGVYETIGRREIEVGLVTTNLATFGGGNLDPDALDLRAGDAIDIEVNRDIDAATITAIEERTTTTAAEFLKSLGYSPGFAKAYAIAAANLGIQTTFRVRRMMYDWDSESGIVINFELTNYTEVRADKQLPAGEEIKPGDSAGVEPVTVKVDEP